MLYLYFDIILGFLPQRVRKYLQLTRKCHPEAKPKDLVNEESRYIGIHFAALYSERQQSCHFRHFSLLLFSLCFRSILLFYLCGFLLSGSSSAWLERCVRDAEVAGSNPVSPSNVTFDKREGIVFWVLLYNFCTIRLK